MAEAPKRSEFERIAQYFAPLTQDFPGAFGLTDDAAVIAPSSGNELVVTTDTIIAGVHYIGTEAPGLIAAKLLRVNLSDIAAKGATPLAYTLNIALPVDLEDDWLAKFTEGLAADQAEFGIVLIGGDSVATPGPVTLTLTAFGEVPVGKALLRRNAKAGDSVFVTGQIGDGALGLRAARGQLPGISTADSAWLVDRYQRPRARVSVGPGLLGYAHASADVSDGLVADLGHITEASGLSARIQVDSVPLSDAAKRVLQGDPSLVQTVLTGGDDYELVFAAPSSVRQHLDALSRSTGVAITEIGRVDDGKGVTVMDPTGKPMLLSRGGYAHG